MSQRWGHKLNQNSSQIDLRISGDSNPKICWRNLIPQYTDSKLQFSNKDSVSLLENQTREIDLWQFLWSLHFWTVHDEHQFARLNFSVKEPFKLQYTIANSVVLKLIELNEVLSHIRLFHVFDRSCSINAKNPIFSE